jgi:hypothetical protein
MDDPTSVILVVEPFQCSAGKLLLHCPVLCGAGVDKNFY